MYNQYKPEPSTWMYLVYMTPEIPEYNSTIVWMRDEPLDLEARYFQICTSAGFVPQLHRSSLFTLLQKQSDPSKVEPLPQTQLTFSRFSPMCSAECSIDSLEIWVMDPNCVKSPPPGHRNHPHSRTCDSWRNRKPWIWYPIPSNSWTFQTGFFWLDFICLFEYLHFQTGQISLNCSSHPMTPWKFMNSCESVQARLLQFDNHRFSIPYITSSKSQSHGVT